MAYNCHYATDRGCKCNNWTREDAEYCDDHAKRMAQSDEIEKEMQAAIEKARRTQK